jgi:hypothetical protein
VSVGKELFGKLRRECSDFIKMNLRGISFEGIGLSQDLLNGRL